MPALKKSDAPDPEPADREMFLDDLDSRSRALLTSWMAKYVDKAGEIDSLKADLETIKKEKIEPLRLKLGLTKIDSDDWYIARRQGRPSLDKDKLKLYLLNNRVPVGVISDAFEAATSKGKPFTEIKRKGTKESE